MNQSKLRGLGWALIIMVLAIEGLGVLWVTWNSIVSAVTDAQNPALDANRSMVTVQGIALVLTMLIAALWIVITFVGSLRRRNWARSSHLTVQVLVVAAATGVLQGILGTPLIGWGLLLLGVAGLAGVIMTLPDKAQREVAE
ncbi:hypothetical protein JSO19_01850 [Leucobacter sp. UCMA 4100]|uniref:hypothetical protein n=1 Tax=Leucobacter sp. UCMA 4100 TaxID=2810534 RepID=UPI0022EB4F60|nr:hypothetical protein [Leucobacter sp. UCMA 4100]MDA3146118.1 hypothetical protein [Leucobacter sp. UCMA 4100]